MSYALEALLLIALDANAGTWMPMAELCRRLRMTSQQIRPKLSELADYGQVMAAHVSGDHGDLECYGVHVDASSPVLGQSLPPPPAPPAHPARRAEDRVLHSIDL